MNTIPSTIATATTRLMALFLGGLRLKGLCSEYQRESMPRRPRSSS
eukprot:CAMPEP_0119425108 /NCGR_PEP_ID=MMETSP1335-20130426/33883_1 /TAXON_ID=259385 /ORGANISM="Chrysoculter rhomboideus, Strain RCC1486" /LENGTH=45 /DNA_ID= /DNA_START= /DNA_END= /DNA_ORIENTATION=